MKSDTERRSKMMMVSLRKEEREGERISMRHCIKIHKQAKFLCTRESLSTLCAHPEAWF